MVEVKGQLHQLPFFYKEHDVPTYTFRNKETLEETTQVLSLAERESFLEQNSKYMQVPPVVAFGDSVRLGVRRIDNGFNDVLKKAKSAHPHGTIETRN
jgi:hypothetical protein